MAYIFPDLSNVFRFGRIPWTLPWKGVALWKSARLGQKWWFIALLLFQTLGLLEILYIFVFSKNETD